MTAAPKPTPIVKEPKRRRWRRKDPMPEWLVGYIYARDRTCVPARIGAPDPCSGHLTIEHVRDRDKPATGKRAPSDKYHTLLACLGHNTGWCLLSSSKEAERDYLERVEGVESVW